MMELADAASAEEAGDAWKCIITKSFRGLQSESRAKMKDSTIQELCSRFPCVGGGGHRFGKAKEKPAGKLVARGSLPDGSKGFLLDSKLVTCSRYCGTSIKVKLYRNKRSGEVKNCDNKGESRACGDFPVCVLTALHSQTFNSMIPFGYLDL